MRAKASEQRRPLRFELDMRYGRDARKTVRFRGETLYVVEDGIARGVGRMEWNPLRESLDFLDVWNWKPFYGTPGDETSDEFQWKLSLAYADKAAESAGRNRFPAYVSPAEESVHHERFGLLAIAVGQAMMRRYFLNALGWRD